MKRKGFTLIELLVVIGIIAILAAILFPVFAKARERAALAGCLSNVKQIAMAVMMYCDDHDGRGPGTWWYQINGTEYMMHWREKLEAYGAAFWIRPDVSYWPTATIDDVNQKLWICKSGAHWSTYNLRWIAGGYYLPYPQGWKITGCRFPSETMLIGECPWENLFYGPPYPAGRDPMHNSHMNSLPYAFIGPKEHPWLLGGPSSAPSWYPAGPVPEYAAGHGIINTMAMYDGHAQTMTPGQMLTDVTTKWQSWWNDQTN